MELELVLGKVELPSSNPDNSSIEKQRFDTKPSQLKPNTYYRNMALIIRALGMSMTEFFNSELFDFEKLEIEENSISFI